MEVLRDEPYLLDTGDILRVTIESFNIIGYSEPSDLSTSTADIRTIPDAPTTPPQRVDELTTDTSITIVVSNFDSAPENGGSPILSLSVWWDQGVSNWVSISGDYPNYTLQT